MGLSDRLNMATRIESFWGEIVFYLTSFVALFNWRRRLNQKDNDSQEDLLMESDK